MHTKYAVLDYKVHHDLMVKHKTRYMVEWILLSNRPAGIPLRGAICMLCLSAHETVVPNGPANLRQPLFSEDRHLKQYSSLINECP